MYRDHDLGKRLRATQEAAGNLLFNRMKLAQGEQRAHARHEHKSQQSTERQKQDRAEPVLGQTRPRRFLRKSGLGLIRVQDRKSTRLNSSHVAISYAVFCLKKKKHKKQTA